MIWLMIDKQFKRSIIYTQLSSTYEERIKESSNKKVDQVEINEEWLSFNDQQEAASYSRANYPCYDILINSCIS